MTKKYLFLLLIFLIFFIYCAPLWSAGSGFIVRTDVQHALIEINGETRPEWTVTEFNKSTGFWEKEIYLPPAASVSLKVLSHDRKLSCTSDNIPVKDGFLVPVICTKVMMSPMDTPPPPGAPEGLSPVAIAGVLITLVLAGVILAIIFFYKRTQEARRSVPVAAESSVHHDFHEGQGRMLGEMLIESGIINEEQLEHALAVQKTKGEKIGKILEDLGFASKDSVTRALSEKLNIQIITYTGQMIPSGMKQEASVWGMDSRDADKTQLLQDEMGKTGSFEMVRLLSDQGGMADVYEAYQPSLKRKVAAKKLKKEFFANEDVRRRFEDEAISLAKLNHPNIVQIIDFNKENLILFLEFIDGRTLDVILKEKGKFPVPQAVKVFAQILNGLQYAHDKGLVHRDIKPSNIFITKEDEVKITDFGIAKIIGGNTADQLHKTRLGVWVGTPSYMSPEQFLGETVDPRTDIYASGVMLYQLVTAKLPFAADTLAQLAFLHTRQSCVPPVEISKDIPDSLNGIILRALEKKPQNRFQSVREFRDALSTVF